MSDDLKLEEIVAKRCKERQAVMEAEEADVILLSAMTRNEWLVQLDRIDAEAERIEPAADSG